MGYNARLNPQHLKGSLLVFVEISLDYKSGDTFEEFRRAVLKLPHVLECHLVSGDFDYLVKARISEMASYRKLLGDILLKLPHVRESKSYIVMEEVKRACACRFRTEPSDQHLAGAGDIGVDQLFGRRIDRLIRTPSPGAGQTRRGAEQATDHRALCIDRAAVRAKVYAVQALQRGVLLGLGLARQAGHFLGRGGDRAAAIMAAGLALERGDEFAQEVNLVAVAGHEAAYLENVAEL